MGNTKSKSQNVDSDTLNWSDINTDDVKLSDTNDVKLSNVINNQDIIHLDFDFTESEASTNISNLFQKKSNKSQQLSDSNSSPFISTEVYNKIMQSGGADSSSPFVNTEIYNKIIGNQTAGGSSDSSSSDDSDDSTSDSSEMFSSLGDITVSSSDRNIMSDTSINSSDFGQNMYGFSSTSSEVIQTSDNNYYINSNVSSDTPYKVNSESINTDDINIVSADGQRFL